MDGKPATGVLRGELLDTLEAEFSENAKLLLKEAEEQNSPIVDTWEKIIALQTEAGGILYDWALTEALIDAESCVDRCLVPILERLNEISGRSEVSPHTDPVFRDSIKVFAYEFSLYATASLIEVDEPKSIHRLFRHPFVSGNEFHASANPGLSEFYHHSQIADSWNDKQERRWISPLAQKFSERVSHPKLSMEKLVQAESLIFVDAILESRRSYPSTVAYARRGKPFPWFMKASSSRNPDRLAEVIGRDDWDTLRREFFQKFEEATSGSSYPVFRIGGGEDLLRLLSFAE